MADYIVVTAPVVSAVSITPSPCSINQSVAVSVTVTETSVTRYPEPHYSGEFAAGEA